MNKKIQAITAIFIFSLISTAALPLFGHCQVPCGIYDDQMRIKLMAEHITTIEKAMKQIKELSKKTPVNYNQIVRWVVNKEKHAEEIDSIVTYYFLTQRVKPAKKADAAQYTKYQQQLELLHQLLFYTMKAKQSVDETLIPKLRETLKKFENLYFGGLKTHSH
jgi:nickel superoxide dismutase